MEWFTYFSSKQSFYSSLRTKKDMDPEDDDGVAILSKHSKGKTAIQ